MATTPVEFRAPGGLSLALELYPYGSDTIANGAGGDSATEKTNRNGLYSVDVTEALSGWHTAHVMLSSTVIDVLDVYLEDDTDIKRCHQSADLGLEQLVEVAATAADIADDSIAAKLVSASATADWDDFDNTTDSLQAIRDRGDVDWSTASENPNVLQSTTIATLAIQTSFTLTDGSADDDAYNNMLIVVTDSATSTQKAVGVISDYTGSTKTVTLRSDPGVFTMAAGDSVAIIAGATSSSVWTHSSRTLTQTAQQIEDTISGSSVTIHRGDTLSASFTGLGSVSGFTEIWFTVKDGKTKEDSGSTIQITQTSGLVVFQGSSSGLTAGNGSITVDDAGNGDLTVTLAAVETAKLTPTDKYVYDIQVLNSGTVSTLSSGTLEVVSDITRSTS